MKPVRSSSAITRPFDRDLLRVGAIASAVSVFSLLYYFHRGQILLYGDAVAHINIARRVFDSATPGLLQLGTVWLPLPHLLMIPLLFFDSLWQSGLGGSIPSMIGYVLGVLGVFRLVRGIASANANGRAAAWVAALVYGTNPNLMYVQTTALTEPLYLACFVWAVLYVFEFLEKQATTEDADVHGGKLWKCLFCVIGAELTRYDGWFLGGAIGLVVFIFALLRLKDRSFRLRALMFLLGIGLAPALWLAYNAVVYRNAWEFANGPYSARAIEEKSGAINPAQQHMVTAGSYFLKSAQLNVANGNWGRVWLVAAVVILVFSLVKRAFLLPVVLLWTPLFFYAFSIAHGGVPLYIPAWWPFTWYNIRYGLELLPLFAVSIGILVASHAAKRHRRVLAAVICAIVIASYASVWRAQPLCLTEALVNSRTRVALEGAVARAIEEMPRRARFLMYLGNHVGVFQRAGVPLRQVVNEGNHRPWKKPSDPEGLWERTLADPLRYVDYVIAFEGDEVDRSVERKNLTLLSVIHTSGQAGVRIYACVANERLPLR